MEDGGPDHEFEGQEVYGRTDYTAPLQIDATNKT
jgi:hypothetical protein